MRSYAPRPPRQHTPDDIGTLWTMRRRGMTARCAFMTSPRGWEVRVLVDGSTLLSEQCDRAEEAFALADGWKQRMIDQGWRQLVPQPHRADELPRSQP